MDGGGGGGGREGKGISRCVYVTMVGEVGGIGCLLLWVGRWDGDVMLDLSLSWTCGDLGRMNRIFVNVCVCASVGGM